MNRGFMGALCFSVTFALLAGCGGSQPPIGAPGAMPQRAAIATDAARSNDGASWMAPDAATQDLLYVSDVRTVTVYSYPRGKYIGTLRHFYVATGMCVDNKGNVFVVDGGYYKIFEYAHGGTKRIATLQSPTKDPVGCSVDPTTGNLAVGSLGFGSAPTVAIWKNARGKSKTYQDSAFHQFYFCSYDDRGNLFVDGLTAPGSGHFGLAELPKGASHLTNIAVSQYISYPGGVEWDGKHIAVGDQNRPVIYQLAIAQGHGTVVGTTHMGSGARSVKQFWIQGTGVPVEGLQILVAVWLQSARFRLIPRDPSCTENSDFYWFVAPI
jgi:hypothetical protein